MGVLRMSCLEIFRIFPWKTSAIGCTFSKVARKIKKAWKFTKGSFCRVYFLPNFLKIFGIFCGTVGIPILIFVVVVVVVSS